jgi:hypothetical protein
MREPVPSSPLLDGNTRVCSFFNGRFLQQKTVIVAVPGAPDYPPWEMEQTTTKAAACSPLSLRA